MSRKTKIDTVKLDDDGVPMDPISSLNKYFMCVCGKKFTFRSRILKHLPRCNNENNGKVVCHWCKLEFRNRGNLINHAYYMHGVKKPSRTNFKCDVCDARFSEKWKIKFHIRRDHFNLWARIPLANTKGINQVWFERVLNTNLVMQIKKPAPNKLILKPAPPNADLKIHGINKRVDLRNQYPTNSKTHFLNIPCKYCGILFRKFDLKKHINERHYKLTKHKCNNCNKTFKRSYIYLQHVCHSRINRAPVRGVKHVPNSTIRIASVESMGAVVID